MRSCGDCIVCCVYPRIPELGKGGMEHCVHLSLPGPETTDARYYTGDSCGNCKIYDSPEKPACCSKYNCAWRAGFGSEFDRPDKVLMLFDSSKGIDNCLEAKPLRDGEESTQEGREVIDRMSKSIGKPVVVLNFYERRVVRIAGRAV